MDAPNSGTVLVMRTPPGDLGAWLLRPLACPCGINVLATALPSCLFASGRLIQTTSEAGASCERGRVGAVPQALLSGPPAHSLPSACPLDDESKMQMFPSHAKLVRESCP